MADKWEVVGGGKKKKIGNGQINHVKVQSQISTPTPTPVSKSNGKVKRSKKVTMDYRVKPEDAFQIPDPSENEATNSATAVKPKKKPTNNKAGTGSKKTNDLEAALEKVSTGELSSFFEELRNAGSGGDVYLSWIKYVADALNSRIAKVPPPEVNQYPNDLEYPILPRPLQETVRSIISKTTNSVRNDSNDVMGISFASLLAFIPNLLQRGDPGWGYLLFLREMVRMDPDVLLRRSKGYAELMESFGNRKEVGTACLWVSAQACLQSRSVLRIVTGQIVPYYNYKHYKNFVVSVLGTLAVADMAAEIIVETDEFEEFFEASFDPKKRKDFEKFYPRIKELTLKSLNGRGSELFTNFLLRVGEKDFNPASLYGHETLEILHGCLENDPSVIAYWSSLVTKFPRESAALLNYLSNNVANVHCARPLESQFIQSDEFALAAVKNPELVRAAKKLQVGVKRVEASRKRFSWKMGTYVLLLTIFGLLWLDVAENGKGSFAKSNVGKFLETYGLLDEALYVGEQTSKVAKLGYDYAAPIFRNIYEGLRPLLQAIDKQLQIYIPELVEFLGTVSAQITTYVKYLTDKVFVGSLSPENLRKLTKDVLSFVWTNLFTLTNRLFDLVSLLVQTVQGYLQ